MATSKFTTLVEHYANISIADDEIQEDVDAQLYPNDCSFGLPLSHPTYVLLENSSEKNTFSSLILGHFNLNGQMPSEQYIREEIVPKSGGSMIYRLQYTAPYSYKIVPNKIKLNDMTNEEKKQLKRPSKLDCIHSIYNTNWKYVMMNTESDDIELSMFWELKVSEAMWTTACLQSIVNDDLPLFAVIYDDYNVIWTKIICIDDGYTNIGFKYYVNTQLITRYCISLPNDVISLVISYSTQLIVKIIELRDLYGSIYECEPWIGDLKFL